MEILLLVKDVKQLQLLPRSLRTLKRRTRSQLPLLFLRRKEIQLRAVKMPSRKAGDKMGQTTVHKEWIYFLGPLNLFVTMLVSSDLIAKMHFGLGHDWNLSVILTELEK